VYVEGNIGVEDSENSSLAAITGMDRRNRACTSVHVEGNIAVVDSEHSSLQQSLG
jgi:hypothetical protein